MWTTAFRKRIHRFIDSTAAYIYIYYTNVVFLLFRICVNTVTGDPGDGVLRLRLSLF